MSETDVKKYMKLWETTHKLEGDAVTGGCDVEIQNKITDLKSVITAKMRCGETSSDKMPASGIKGILNGNQDDGSEPEV